MGFEVRNLSKHPKCYHAINHSRIVIGIQRSRPPGCCGGGSRRVQGVGKIHPRKDPVVCRVPKDIAKGHRATRKAVDKEGFIFALEEMKNDQCAQKRLRLGWRRELLTGFE